MGFISNTFAQRRGSAKTTGTAAEVIYRQDFEEQNRTDFTATGCCSARFLKATMPEVMDNTTPKGFTAKWQNSGIGGSKGALKIIRTGDSIIAAVEKYIDIPSDNTTLAFAYLAKDLNASESLYVQGWGNKINKNLHAFVNVTEEDVWQIAKIKLNSMIGFGGGSCTPGEIFNNLAFVTSWDEDSTDAYLLIDNIIVFSGIDGVPPSKPPSSLAIIQDGEDIILTWAPAKDDLGLLSYEIHRSEKEDFTPKRSTRIGRVFNTSFKESNIPSHTVYYIVVGKDLGGFRVVSDKLAFTPKKTITQDDMEF